MDKVFFSMLILLLLLQVASGQRYGESDDFSYALKLYNEGFYDIAAQQFNLFVDKYPSSERVPEARFYLGLSLFNSKDYENARIEFQDMAVRFPDHSRAPEAWQKVGDSYLQLQKLSEAARSYETVKVLYPTHPLAPAALYQAAAIYLKERKIDKAELTLKDFLDRYPESNIYPNGRLLYADLLSEKQDYDQALSEYDKVLKSGAEASLQAQAYLGIGQLYAKLGQYERAKENFHVVITKYPSSAAAFPAILSSSEILAVGGDFENASKLINENLSKYRDQNRKAQLNLALAGVYFFQDNFYSARKTLESITISSLNDTLAMRSKFYLGMVYLREEKYDQSINHFRNILEDPNAKIVANDIFTECYKQLGKAYLKQGQYDQGLGVLQAFLTDYPDHPAKEEILSDLFFTALNNGHFSDADNFYRRFLTELPAYPQRDILLFALAKNYFLTADYLSARNKFQDFINKYACSSKIDSARNYLGIIQNYYLIDQKNGVNKLAKLMGRVLAQENKQMLKLELARVYLLQLNDIEEANLMADEVLQTSSDSSLLGEAHQIKGEGWRRLAELKRFQGNDDRLERQQASAELKNAMNFVRYIENPDSLTFYFLSEMIASDTTENLSREKQIQFWEHFIGSYPTSRFAEQAGLFLANLYFDTQNIDAALRELNKLRKSARSNITGEAYYLTGKIYYDQKNFDQAAEILKEFLLNITIHPLRANAFGLLARIYENQGDFQTAAQFWSKLIEEYDYSPAAMAAKIRIPEIYLAANDFKSAIDYTQSALKEFKISYDLVLRKLQVIKEPEFYFFNGKARYFAAELGESRIKLLYYLYAAPEGKYYDESLFLLAEIALAERDGEGALLYLQPIVRSESSPFFLQATAKIADIYLARKEYDKAQVLYSKLVSKTAENELKIGFQSSEMICLINQGNLKVYDSKLSLFQKEFKKQSGYENYLAEFEFELGKYAYLNKNYDAAIKRFETAIQKYRKTDYADDAEYYLGLSYTTLNKVEKAMDILTGFAEKYPVSPLKANIYITLGGLYYRAEKRELAVGSFQKAVEMAHEPETRKLALSNLISIYRDLGLWDGVLSEARKYVEEFPQAADIIDKKIMIGTAMTNLNRYSDAVDFLKNLKFEANSEQEPEIQFYIGEAYFNSGQYENAIREFVKIPLLSKQTKLQWEASALYYSGQAYEKMGRKVDAIRMYQEIVDRPGILVELKKEAQKRIEQLKESD
jgi:tol-pal system protein YbgF